MRSGSSLQRRLVGTIAGWLLAALSGLVAPAGASGVEVAEKIQVPILLKVLTYDRALMASPPSQLGIVVVYVEGHAASEENRDALIATLQDYQGKTINGIPFRVLPIAFESATQLRRDLEAQGAHVVYVTPGHEDNLDAIRHATQQVGALSVTGTRGFAARGLSVGVELAGDRPRIHVNLRSLAEEGHELKSSVLRLSEIVGGRP